MSRLTPVATPVSTYVLPAVRRPEQAQLGPGPQAPLAGPSQAAQLSEAAQQLAAVTGSLIGPVLRKEVSKAREEGFIEGSQLDPLQAKENARTEALKLKSINPLLAPVQYARQVARIETMADNAVERVKDEAIAALPRLTDPDSDEDLDTFIESRVNDFAFSGIAKRQALLKAEAIRRELQPQVTRAKAARLEESKNKALVNRGSLIAANVFDNGAEALLDLKDASKRHYEEYGTSGRRYLLQGLIGSLEGRVRLARQNKDADEIQRLIGSLDSLTTESFFSEDEKIELEAALEEAETIANYIESNPEDLAADLRKEQIDVERHYYNVLRQNPQITEDEMAEEVRNYVDQQGYEPGASERFIEGVVKPRFDRLTDEIDEQTRQDANEQASGLVLGVLEGSLNVDDAISMLRTIDGLDNAAAADSAFRMISAGQQRRRTKEVIRNNRRQFEGGLQVFQTASEFAFAANPDDAFSFNNRLNSAVLRALESEWNNAGLPEEDFATWADERTIEIIDSIETDPETGGVKLNENSPMYETLLPYVQEINRGISKSRRIESVVEEAGNGKAVRQLNRVVAVSEDGLAVMAEKSSNVGREAARQAERITQGPIYAVKPDGVYKRKTQIGAPLPLAGPGVPAYETVYLEETGEKDASQTANLVMASLATGKDYGLSPETFPSLVNPRVRSFFLSGNDFQRAWDAWKAIPEGDERRLKARYSPVMSSFNYAKSILPPENFPYSEDEEGVLEFFKDQNAAMATWWGLYIKELD